MIFISHTKMDKELVEPIATALAQAFGVGNVFYDSWSIQPGEDIIDKMNTGLEKCELFFFFMSKNSLTSEMVKLEWQNMLMKASNNRSIKFIPVKVDDCTPPLIIMQKLYIDVFSYGIEVGTRQIIDVISGVNTYKNQLGKYENVEYEMSFLGKNSIKIVISAKSYMEPIAKFIILIDNDDGITANVTGENMITRGMNKGVKLSNGTVTNAYLVGISRALTPLFPIEITLQSSAESIIFKGIMMQKSLNNWERIPGRTI